MEREKISMGGEIDELKIVAESTTPSGNPIRKKNGFFNVFLY